MFRLRPDSPRPAPHLFLNGVGARSLDDLQIEIIRIEYANGRVATAQRDGRYRIDENGTSRIVSPDDLPER